MAAIHETAYPRLKSSYSEEELTLTYTPTEKEVAWVSQRARDESTQLALLTLLKVFGSVAQRANAADQYFRGHDPYREVA